MNIDEDEPGNGLRATKVLDRRGVKVVNAKNASAIYNSIIQNPYDVGKVPVGSTTFVASILSHMK